MTRGTKRRIRIIRIERGALLKLPGIGRGFYSGGAAVWDGSTSREAVFP